MVDDNGKVTAGPENLKNPPARKIKADISKEMSPVRTDYVPAEDRDDWVHQNVKRLLPLYEEGGSEAIDSEWYKHRLAESTKDIHQISKDEADEVIYDNDWITQSLYDGWFRNADSTYKPKLLNAMLKDPETRNAGLNLAYENYRHSTDSPLSFREFLTTPIKVYRGEHGQKHIEDDVFDAYTFDRSMAEHFAGKDGTILEAEIRPIDTYGSMRAVGEAEIWIPREIAPESRRDSLRRLDGWEWSDPVKWAFEDYLMEPKEDNSELYEAVLDDIIREAQTLELFSDNDSIVGKQIRERCIDAIQTMVAQLTAITKDYNNDSAFFAGELDDNLGENEVLYPEVEAFRERRKKRLDAKEKGRWITTENGHRVHLNEQGEPDKGNPRVIDVMGSESIESRSAKDFYPKNSYQETPEFKDCIKAWKTADKKADDAWKRVKELDERIKAEFTKVPLDQITDDDLDDLDTVGFDFGKLTDTGKKLRKDRDKAFSDYQKANKEAQGFSDRMDVLKSEAAVEQLRAYKQPELKKAADDDYKGFTLETTGTGFGDEHLKNGFVAEMSPGEYLERCAYEIFDRGTLESTLNGAMDKDVQKYAEMMRGGVKFDLPYLDYRGLGQEGRHRALAAYVNGIEKIPVLIIGRPPSKNDLKEKAAKIERDISKPDQGETDLDKWLSDNYEVLFDGDMPVRVNYDCDKDYKRALSRLDAGEEEGRWVTTENDHRIHINGEGVPDKGNPYVLRTMRGEGDNPHTMEEVVRRRTQRRVAKVKDSISEYDKLKKELSLAKRDRNDAEVAAERVKRRFKSAERQRAFIESLNYGEGAKAEMEKESAELAKKIEELRGGRMTHELYSEERDKLIELETRKNQLDFAVDTYDECYGPTAITEDMVSKAAAVFEEAQKREKDAEKAAEKARKSISGSSGSDSPDKLKLYTKQERLDTVEKIKSSGALDAMGAENKQKVIDTLSNASDVELQLFSDTIEKAHVNDSEGRTSIGGSTAWYTHGTGSITMSQEDMENTSVFFHEYGHFLDDGDVSGCRDGESHFWDASYSEDLSDVVERSHILHGAGAAEDFGKILEESGASQYKINTSENSGYLVITNSETGEVLEGAFLDDALNKITVAVNEKFRTWIYEDPEYDEYLKSVGYPSEKERPKYSDYFEQYVTPKRKIHRSKPKFPDAGQKFINDNREFQEKRDTAMEQHPELTDRIIAHSERSDDRRGKIGPISDILCGAFHGRGLWIYGSHSQSYYHSDVRKPALETVANYHQMRAMGWSDAVGLLERISPSIAKGLNETYNEWLWRNVRV